MHIQTCLYRTTIDLKLTEAFKNTNNENCLTAVLRTPSQNFYHGQQTNIRALMGFSLTSRVQLCDSDLQDKIN
ncbi:Predicted protein [Komagataella phaffii CBS 7435]|nr:Predicted protein [Komagataella phaffii CBS 7435]